jgi:hypothetical protein
MEGESNEADINKSRENDCITGYGPGSNGNFSVGLGGIRRKIAQSPRES